MPQHRVVITGIGLVTPLGNSTKATWQALLDEKSGITKLHDQKLHDYYYQLGGLVTNEIEILNALLAKKEQAKTDRFIHLALLAASQALQDAGFNNQDPLHHDFGVYLGVGIGGLETIRQASLVGEQQDIRRLSPFMIPRAINNMAPNWVAMLNKLHGPNLAITSACASGGDAVGLAYRLIRDGYATGMLAGGTESCVNALAIGAFGNMRTLSKWQEDPTGASRPFAHDRSGFVLAEGAGIMVLERYEDAQKRNAPIYAEIVGYGSTSDAHHITAMHPEGLGAIKAMQQALHAAEINPEQVGYINAHGTSTQMNDVTEAQAIAKTFGDHADKNNKNHLLISSTKSMTGHMIGAAGGVEIAFTALALKHQIVPPTINLHTPDPACGNLDFVPLTARESSCDYALSNAFGFGGSNSVVVLKRA